MTVSSRIRKRMRPNPNASYIALPPGVSLRQVYADFLGYLLQHTKSFFEDRILDGKQIWMRYQPKMEVVIAHPNGWGIREQTFLREAAVEAGFADRASAPTKIRFVTEAEASVHFCIYHTNLGERLKVFQDFGRGRYDGADDRPLFTGWDEFRCV